MRRPRQAKIIATLGPASRSPDMVRELFMAGSDVFRLNFSHGEHADHARSIEIIRALEIEFGRREMDRIPQLMRGASTL